MPGTIEDGLRALREATELAKTIRVDLDEGYLKAIALAEALPDNQAGADKTWVWRLIDTSARHFIRARKKR